MVFFANLCVNLRGQRQVTVLKEKSPSVPLCQRGRTEGTFSEGNAPRTPPRNTLISLILKKILISELETQSATNAKNGWALNNNDI
jgi:hypothetical protein